eukprot:238475-Amphidinium_carterae.1
MHDSAGISAEVKSPALQKLRKENPCDWRLEIHEMLSRTPSCPLAGVGGTFGGEADLLSGTAQRLGILTRDSSPLGFAHGGR